VPTNAVVQLQFSKGIDPLTVNNTTFYIYPAASGIPVPATLTLFRFKRGDLFENPRRKLMVQAVSAFEPPITLFILHVAKVGHQNNTRQQQRTTLNASYLVTYISQMEKNFTCT
jgi:hypothetical protein